jgi:uncharacterized membrane protein YkvA (DUF1232 family)
MVLRLVIAWVIGLIVLWLVFAIVVVVRRPSRDALRDVAVFFPLVVRLVWALARDPNVPRGARWRLTIAFVYCAQPINLIPDFIPVIGFADNVVIVAWALRGTVRLAGHDIVAEQWKGSTAQLERLYRIARLPRPPAAP